MKFILFILLIDVFSNIINPIAFKNERMLILITFDDNYKQQYKLHGTEKSRSR
jgi:hypothetical protein